MFLENYRLNQHNNNDGKKPFRAIRYRNNYTEKKSGSDNQLSLDDNITSNVFHWQNQCTLKPLYTNRSKNVRLIKCRNELNREILNTLYCTI